MSRRICLKVQPFKQNLREAGDGGMWLPAKANLTEKQFEP